jgi:hypothetical protein
LDHSRLLSGPAGACKSPLPYGRATSPSGRFPHPESRCGRRNEYAKRLRPVRSPSLNLIHSVKKTTNVFELPALGGTSRIDAERRDDF